MFVCPWCAPVCTCAVESWTVLRWTTYVLGVLRVPLLVLVVAGILFAIVSPPAQRPQWLRGILASLSSTFGMSPSAYHPLSPGV